MGFYVFTTLYSIPIPYSISSMVSFVCLLFIWSDWMWKHEFLNVCRGVVRQRTNDFMAFVYVNEKVLIIWFYIICQCWMSVSKRYCVRCVSVGSSISDSMYSKREDEIKLKWHCWICVAGGSSRMCIRFDFGSVVIHCVRCILWMCLRGRWSIES